MLTASVFEFTRPMTYLMIFGLLAAAVMRVGFSMSVGMTEILQHAHYVVSLLEHVFAQSGIELALPGIGVR